MFLYWFMVFCESEWRIIYLSIYLSLSLTHSIIHATRLYYARCYGRSLPNLTLRAPFLLSLALLLSFMRARHSSACRLVRCSRYSPLLSQFRCHSRPHRSEVANWPAFLSFQKAASPDFASPISVVVPRNYNFLFFSTVTQDLLPLWAVIPDSCTFSIKAITQDFKVFSLEAVTQDFNTLSFEAATREFNTLSRSRRTRLWHSFLQSHHVRFQRTLSRSQCTKLLLYRRWCTQRYLFQSRCIRL